MENAYFLTSEIFAMLRLKRTEITINKEIKPKMNRTYNEQWSQA